METLCPCRSGATFAECCEPFVRGQRGASTAEALMRSRYSAFSTGEADYIVRTQHESTRSGRDRADVLKTIAETDWVNLIVIATERGQVGDDDGIVEFVAAFKSKPLNLFASSSDGVADIRQMRERSSFVKEGGKWFYTDGKALPPHEPKRNEPCWCGSGKKMKQCHG